MAPSGIGREALVCGTKLLAEDAKCSPTSSWWALETPMIRTRLGSGTEAKRGALRRVMRDRGGDRAVPAATGVF